MINADSNHSTASGSSSSSRKRALSSSLPNISPKSITSKEFITRGSEGTIYRAEMDGQTVAIKEYTGNSSHDHESSLLQNLNHPNIVRIHGLIRSSALVMEYAPKDLLSYAIENEASHPSVLLNILVEVAHALAYLHQELIIHCDIKPENILLSSDGVAKLCDFGIARKVDSEAEMQEGVKTKLKGTIQYLAPETIPLDDQMGIISSASDAYSFGVLIWAVYTRSIPFAGKNIYLLKNEIRDKKAVLTFDQIQDQNVRQIVRALCQFSKADRPSDREVVQRLSTYQGKAAQ